METKNHSVPQVGAPLPGPKARAIIELDEAHTSTSYIKEYPLVAESGSGCWITDADGNRFLDFMAGIAVNSTGYGHPKVVAAIKDAADKVWHICGTDFYLEPMARLAAKLASLVPAMGKKRVFFSNSGTEAVEAGIKLAKYHTRRPAIIAFEGAFHGRTMGALALTASKSRQRAGFGVMMPGVFHARYPDPLRRPAGMSAEEHGEECIRTLERELFGRFVDPADVAAFFVEPIQGEGGYVVPPVSFLRGLRALADKHGILLAFDEVQSGVGRTGSMYAADHFGVAPDILMTAKGLGSGMPIGAMLAREGIMNWTSGSHGNTYGGNALCCAAALATLEIVEELLPSVARVGEHFTRRLQELARKYPMIAEVRGPGLMIGMELWNPKTKQAVPETLAALEQLAFRRGLLLLGCGKSTVRFAPPLVLTCDEVDTGIEILDRCLAELA